MIGYGLTLGSLSRISVENLDNQARDVRETRAAEFTGRAGRARGACRRRRGRGGRGGTADPTPALGVIAVVVGRRPRARSSATSGVAVVVQGGQTSNPSTGELLEAVTAVDAREVLLLPNNPNVVLAARQVAALARPARGRGRRPGTPPKAFAALLALDPTLGARGELRADDRAPRARSRPSSSPRPSGTRPIGGKKVKRGQTIALDPDDGLVAVDGDRRRRSSPRSRALQPGYELLTIFYGDGADLAEAEGMAKRIGAQVPGSRRGGPPRRPALLPVPDLGGVGVPKATSPVPPPPVDPVELLDTPLARSGLAAGATLRRAGIRLGVYDVRDLLFYLPAALRRPARDAPARRPRASWSRGPWSRHGCAWPTSRCCPRSGAASSARSRS